MEKELFISTLKEKAGVDNISERSFNEVANLFHSQFVDDEKITDESWAMPLQVLKTMSGQLRHDLSDGIASFKTSYEKDNKAANEKAIADAIEKAKTEWEEAQKRGGKGGDDDEKDLDKKISDAIKAAFEQAAGDDGVLGKYNKTLTDFIVKAEKEKKEAHIAKVRESLRDYLLDERGANREPVVNLALKELVIDEQSDVDKLKVDAEKKYEKLYKEFYGDSHSAPFAGSGSGQTSAVDEINKWAKMHQQVADDEAKAAEELEKHFRK